MELGKLKPCPFCGGKASPIFLDIEQSFKIVCSDCHIGQYHFFNKEMAIKAWNTRKGKNDQMR